MSRSVQIRGMVLIDAVVGTIILGVALASMFGIMGRSLSHVRQGERLHTVAALLDEKLNEMLVYGPQGFGTVFEDKGRFEAPFEAYRYAIDVRPGAPGRPDRVRATVFWHDGSHKERSESVETLIAPRLGEEPDPDRFPPQVEDRIR